MRGSVLGRTAAGLVIAAVLVLSTAVVAYRADLAVQENGSWITHTNEVLAELNALREAIRSAESDVRGYVLSGDPEYLSSYRATRSRIDEEQAKLRRLTSDNPRQQRRLDELKRVTAAKLSLIAHNIETRRSYGASRASEFVASGEGKRAMDAVETVLRTISGEEEGLLSARQERLAWTVRRTQWTFSAIIAADLLLLGLVYWMLHQYLAERKRHVAIIQTQHDDLQVRTAQAQRANDMKSKFLANMSHELRTPLNSILGFSELLQGQSAGTLNAKQMRWVANVRTAGKHLLQLINDILDLAKIEAGQLSINPEDFTLATALPEVLTVIRPLAMEKNMSIVQEITPELLVRADRVRVKQILYNLLSNAVKFSPAKSTITIAARATPGFVHISVTDQGIGIAADQIEAVFEEFRQIESSDRASVSSGTGLGLTITRSLVERQGGRISAHSEPGVGTTFTFSLPAAEAAQQAETPAIEPPGRRSKAVVLVIDDESTTVELISEHLQQAGYAVVSALNVENAISAAQRYQPDVITLDILMPSGSGWALLAELKSDLSTAHIPIVIVSVLDRRQVGFALGANDYLVKPVQKEMLIETIRRHVGSVDTQQAVVVIDDNAADLQVMSEVAQGLGFSTVEAMSGTEGLKQIYACSPSAVLLDLMLPDLSGLEVLTAVRNDTRFTDLPVIIVTAKELTPDDLRSIELHAAAHVRKIATWKDDLVYRVRAAVDPPHAAAEPTR